MAKYRWKYMDETTLKEMDELLKGEHGSTLKLWSMECADATQRGIAKAVVKGAVIGLTLGVAKRVIQKRKEKRNQKIEEILEKIENPEEKES